MITSNLKEFTGGWFIGNFIPTFFKTDQFEVAIKYYKSGDKEVAHFHKLSEEITVVINGKISMHSTEYNSGDIILTLKNESTNFEAIEDSTTCVIKIPSSKNDKYIL